MHSTATDHLFLSSLSFRTSSIRADPITEANWLAGREENARIWPCWADAAGPVSYSPFVVFVFGLGRV